MSALYLKGVLPKHVTLNQSFAGMIPYMIIVGICLVFIYVWPGMTLWLPGVPVRKVMAADHLLAVTAH
jgi:TRAP-type mannitol/chloroaromatic compound transport system permease large subunit